MKRSFFQAAVMSMLLYGCTMFQHDFDFWLSLSCFHAPLWTLVLKKKKKKKNTCAWHGVTSIYLLKNFNWDFFYSPILGNNQRGPFWRSRSHQESRNDGAGGHTRIILPVVSRSVAEKHGKVRFTRRELLWRRNDRFL